MNFHENRGNIPTSFASVPRPLYTNLETITIHSNQPFYQDRQLDHQSNFVKAFSQKEYQYFRPQPNLPTGPLTFNLTTPARAKVKKTARPVQKNAKSFVHPFTQQLESQFFKNQERHLTMGHLDDFAKTTSTFMGHSYLNQQQIQTQHSQESLSTPLKAFQSNGSRKNLQNKHSFTIFPKNGQTQSRIISNNYNNNGSLQYQVENNRQREANKVLIEEIKSQRETIETFQGEIYKLNGELKSIKSVKDLSSFKDTNHVKKQLDAQYQQNSKLIAQIQNMEIDLNGKKQLHTYLQRQCNTYLQNYTKIKAQYQNYKNSLDHENSKKDQLISSLRREGKEFESKIKSYKIQEDHFIEEVQQLQRVIEQLKRQIEQLKRTMQLQEERIAQQQTNKHIDSSEINVLTTKIQTLQGKYQKLMLNHCENQLRFHHYQELIIKERQEWKNQQNKYLTELKEYSLMQIRLKREKEQLFSQLQAMKQQFNKLSNESTSIKNSLLQKSTYFQNECKNINLQLQNTKHLLTQQINQLNITHLSKSNRIQHLEKQVNDFLWEKQTVQLKMNEILNNCQSSKRESEELNKQYNKILFILKQKQNITQQYEQQMELIKVNSNNIISKYENINKQHQSLLANYTIQTDNYKTLETRLAQNQRQFGSLQKDLLQYSKKYTNLHQQCQNLKLINNDLRRSYAQLVSSNGKCLNQSSNLQDQCKNLMQKCSILQEGSKHLQLCNRNLQEKIKTVEAGHLSLKGENQSLLLANRSLFQKINIVQLGNKSINEKYLSLQKDNKVLKQNKCSLITINQQLQAKYQLLQQKQKNLVKKSESLQLSGHSLKENLSRLEEKNIILQQSNKSFKETNNSLESNIHSIQQNYRILQAKAANFQLKNAELNKQKYDLQKLLDSHKQANNSKNNTLSRDYYDLLNKYKQSGEEYSLIQVRYSDLEKKILQSKRQNQNLLLQIRKYQQNINNIQKCWQSDIQQKNQLISQLSNKTQQIQRYKLQKVDQSKSVQQLNRRINDLNMNLKEKNDQILKKKVFQSTIQSLRAEIESLMKIIQQNQQRNKLIVNQLLLKNDDSNKSNQKRISQLEQQLVREKQLNIANSLNKKIQNDSQCNQSPQGEKAKSQGPHQCQSSFGSPLKIQPYLSSNDLQCSRQVDYIQMDSEGVAYLCELLSIQLKSGNILNQIVARTQRTLQQIRVSKNKVNSYSKLLDMFEIEEGANGEDSLVSEMVGFKENLSLVIQKLHQQQLQHQALKLEYQNLLAFKHTQGLKAQADFFEINNLNILTQNLNDSVFALTATLCNQKIKMMEVLKLAKDNNDENTSILRSQRFVTAKSFPSAEDRSFEIDPHF